MSLGIQRPLRGSRISSFYPVKSLPSLSSLDSAFQLQEYISLLIRLDVHDVDSIVSIPGKTTDKDSENEGNDSEDQSAKDEKDTEKSKGDVSVDESCWIYEQLRRLAQDLSHPLITTLQQECTRASCPEMKAGEWLYLCVAHGNDGAMEQCCAIDYILHTLDSATALLNSPRAFPSRLQIPATSNRHFSSLARRLGRIFAHAYFHHREAFEQAEAESSLYARFLALTAKFDLVPPEFLVIPTSLGGTDADTGRSRDIQPPRLLAASVDSAADRANSGERYSSGLHLLERSNSRSPPGLGIDTSTSIGTDSPRKVGRPRTDTMVHSDTISLSETLNFMLDSPMESHVSIASELPEQAGRPAEGHTVAETKSKNPDSSSSAASEPSAQSAQHAVPEETQKTDVEPGIGHGTANTNPHVQATEVSAPQAEPESPHDFRPILLTTTDGNVQYKIVENDTDNVPTETTTGPESDSSVSVPGEEAKSVDSQVNKPDASAEEEPPSLEDSSIPEITFTEGPSEEEPTAPAPVDDNTIEDTKPSEDASLSEGSPSESVDNHKIPPNLDFSFFSLKTTPETPTTKIEKIGDETPSEVPIPEADAPKVEEASVAASRSPTAVDVNLIDLEQEPYVEVAREVDDQDGVHADKEEKVNGESTDGDVKSIETDKDSEGGTGGCLVGGA